MSSKFYVTTTIPYVNADPHIGFALEIVQADVLARYHQLLGDEVFFNFGTDEHGLKIYRKALERNQDPQAYCDEYAAKFDHLKQALNLSYNNFIRTTDQHHIIAAQQFWQICKQNGDIYKGQYPIKYCVGCEMEKQDSELENGRCPLHPDKEIEIIEEENYFFRWSNYQQALLDLYDQNPDFVLPDYRLNEIKSFVSQGLQDFSISRLKDKMPWGIPVPDDSKHVMYVWFDALINYISALGWPDNQEKFTAFWGTKEQPNAIQFAGKDNLRQQSAMWQAMLMSAGLPRTKQIVIHGFLTVEGQKISKSLGNVIDPIPLTEQYGTDPVRYYLLAEVTPFGDSDYSHDKFVARYNADLANGLGNLVARVAKLCEKSGLDFPSSSLPEVDNQIAELMEGYQYDQVLKYVWEGSIREADRYISEQKPWELKGDRLQTVLTQAVDKIRNIAFNLQPFLPETAEKILAQYEGPKIKSNKPLFPRI